jgi:hypothetical protein
MKLGPSCWLTVRATSATSEHHPYIFTHSLTHSLVVALLVCYHHSGSFGSLFSTDQVTKSYVQAEEGQGVSEAEKG